MFFLPGGLLGEILGSRVRFRSRKGGEQIVLGCICSLIFEVLFNIFSKHAFGRLLGELGDRFWLLVVFC